MVSTGSNPRQFLGAENNVGTEELPLELLHLVNKNIFELKKLISDALKLCPVVFFQRGRSDPKIG
jgi:hypothetical protein